MNKIIWKEPTIIGIGDVIEDNTAGNKSNMLLHRIYIKNYQETLKILSIDTC